MPGIVLIGAQWGDEGKGKATDLIGTKVDYVARFNGVLDDDDDVQYVYTNLDE